MPVAPQIRAGTRMPFIVVLVLLAVASSSPFSLASASNLPLQGCADDNPYVTYYFGDSCPNLAKLDQCNDTKYENITTVHCPVSCGTCVPDGNATCPGLDDNLYMIDTYGFTCKQVQQLGYCTTLLPQTDVIQRCPIACGYCNAPESLDCYPNRDSTFVMDQYGLSCSQLSKLGMCTAYERNAGSARLAAVMEQYCQSSCKTCQKYYNDVNCTSKDNSTACYKIFRQTCAKMISSCHPRVGEWTSQWLIDTLRETCPQTCGYCRPDTPPVIPNMCADSFAVFGQQLDLPCSLNPSKCSNTTFASICAGTCNQCPPLPATVSGCADDDTYVLLQGLPGCAKSAELGYCNSTLMSSSIQSALILSSVLSHCPVSCNSCPTTPEPTTAKGPTPGPCHDDDTYMLNSGFPSCAAMARANTCNINATAPNEEFLLNIMVQRCPLSCGFCSCSNNDSYAVQVLNKTCTQVAAAGKCYGSAVLAEEMAFQVRTHCPLACLQCTPPTSSTTTTAFASIPTSPTATVPSTLPTTAQLGTTTTTQSLAAGDAASSSSAVNAAQSAAIVLGILVVLLLAALVIFKIKARRDMATLSRSIKPRHPHEIQPDYIPMEEVRGQIAGRNTNGSTNNNYSDESDHQAIQAGRSPYYSEADVQFQQPINASSTDDIDAIESRGADSASSGSSMPSVLTATSPNAKESSASASTVVGTVIATANSTYAIPNSDPRSPDSTIKKAYNHLNPDTREVVYEVPSLNAFRVPGKSEPELYDAIGTMSQDIKRKHLELLPVSLGEGSFGEVTKGVLKRPRQPVVDVAVKVLKNTEAGNRVKFLQEAAIMAQFNHENVCKMYGVVKDGDPMLLVLELLPNGSLYDRLKTIKKNGEKITHTQLFKMALDVASAMKYLHSMSFIHRDLAARNCLIGANMQLKIADFGMARDVLDDDYYRSTGGSIPLRWTAPEALFFKKFSPASDVWSFGVLMYEMWTGAARPYGKWTTQKILMEIDRGYRLPLPSGCSTSAYSIMLSCWHPDPAQRPTMVNLHATISDLVSEYSTRLILDTEDDIEELCKRQRSFLKPSSPIYDSFLAATAVSVKPSNGIYELDTPIEPDIDVDTSRYSVSAEITATTAVATTAASTPKAVASSFYQPLTLPSDIETEPTNDMRVPMSAWDTYASMLASDASGHILVSHVPHTENQYEPAYAFLSKPFE